MTRFVKIALFLEISCEMVSDVHWFKSLLLKRFYQRLLKEPFKEKQTIKLKKKK